MFCTCSANPSSSCRDCITAAAQRNCASPFLHTEIPYRTAAGRSRAARQTGDCHDCRDQTVPHGSDHHHLMQPSAPARHFDGIRCGPREGSRSLSRESASMVSAYAAGRSWLRHRLHDETALIRQKGSCVAVVLPENAYLGTSGIDWECSRGFHSVGSRCQLTAVPENAYDCASQYGRGWECTRGHRASAASCEIIKVPMRINRAITPETPSNIRPETRGDNWGYRSLRSGASFYASSISTAGSNPLLGRLLVKGHFLGSLYWY